MTQGYCWVEVNGVVPGPVGPTGPEGPPGPAGSGRDTLFGHGTAYGINPSPVEGEAQYNAVTGSAQLFEDGAWVDHAAQEGDEYVDLDTGITYALRPSAAASLVGVTQRTFVIPEADFLAGAVPPGAVPGDVVLSGTGGYAKLV